MVVSEHAALLRVNLRSIKVIVPTGQILTEEEYHEFIRNINSLLSTLEALLQDGIKDGSPITNSSHTTELIERCPKLLVLERLIQEVPLSELSHFVRLQHDAPAFKAVAYEVKMFNKAVGSVCRATNRTSAFSTSKSYDAQPHSAPSDYLSKDSSRLFHRLAASIQSCTSQSPQHEAMVQLNHGQHFDDTVPNCELCMLLGGCQEPITWQHMLYSASTDAHERDGVDHREPKHRIVDLCFNARIAYDNNQLFRVQLDGESLFDTSEVTVSAENKDIVPTISLRHLLENDLLKQRYRFCPNDKKILAYTLAHSLFNFYGSPWLQQLWNLENILFLYSDKEDMIYNIHQPYVSCIIAGELPPLGELDALHKHPLIFSFAKLLLELETGEEVKPIKISKSGNPSLYLTLQDFCHNSSMHQLSRGYRNALEACLKFSSYCIKERKRNPNVTAQQVIFKHIVQPLEHEVDLSQRMTWGTRNLKLRSRTVSKGISISNTPKTVNYSTFQFRDIKNTSFIPGPTKQRSLFGQPHLVERLSRERKATSLTRPIEEKSLSYTKYTVSIVCAMEFEMSAVRAMLDSEHPRLPNKRGDPNNYVLGQMSGHNIVLACLPGVPGKSAAAKLATDLERTFPCLQSRFLTGIGGGVPGLKNDIRLGDIVVGMPEKSHGGVVQFDLGEDANNGFVRKGFLVPSPSHLRSAITRMRSDHRIHDSKVPAFISAMSKRLKRYQDYEKPSAQLDVLYHAEYPHIEGPTYVKCDATGTYKRPIRQHEGPEIHYGLIASGDRVISSTAIRSLIMQDVGNVLCFEMEAAGVVTEFPYIIVRGISNYADSNKDEIWQNYAAATAAACTKELLAYLESNASVEDIFIPSLQ